MLRSFLFLFSVFFLFNQGQASESWSSPEVVGKDLRFWSAADSAIDPQGNATTLFSCYSPKENTIDIWVEASTKLANGSWSTPVPLTQKADASYGYGVFPKVCVDSDGNAIAVWNFPDGDKEVILAATLPYGSSEWIPAPSPLAVNVERQAGPYLNIDQRGQVLAVWGNQRDGSYYIESARFSKENSRWDLNTPLELPYAFQGLNLHVNEEGKAWLIWMKGDFFLDGQNVTVSTLSPSAQDWSLPETLAEVSGIRYYGPQIVSDSDGNVLATWQEYDQKDLIFVAYQRLNDSTAWKKTAFQNLETHIYTRGWLSLDPDGNALFIWYPNDNMLANSQLLQGQSTWSQPTLITTDDIFYWKGAIDSKGNRLISWIKWGENTLKSATLPVGTSAWTAPVGIAQADGSLEDCILSDDGSAVILYCNPWTTLKAVSGKPF